MKGLTKRIGNTNDQQNYGQIDKSEIKRILVLRPNHRVGNLLLITPLIQELSEIFPGSKIDLFIKGNLGTIVFKNYRNIHQIIPLPKKHFKELPKYFLGWASLKMNKYDLVINVVKGSSSGRLSTKLANSKIKFFGDDDRNLHLTDSNYKHNAKSPVYSLRNFLSKIGIESPCEEIPFLNIKLSEAEIENGKNQLNSLTTKDSKTISLFTNATGAKCYSEEWWEDFYEKLKSKFQDLNIIEILPVENISKISFKEPSFYSKDIREMAALMANTDVFIGADSGIMHLASAAQTPTIGLFSVTNPQIYQPYNTGSMGIDTSKVSKDQILEEVEKILSA